LARSAGRFFSFGPNKPDKTFGPTAVFEKAPTVSGASPFAGYRFFGEVNIDPQTKALTGHLNDLNGVSQFQKVLNPEGA
jgi:alkaline phosphatase D